MIQISKESKEKLLRIEQSNMAQTFVCITLCIFSPLRAPVSFLSVAWVAWGEEKKSHSGLAARLENRIAFYMRLSFLAAFNVI